MLVEWHKYVGPFDASIVMYKNLQRTANKSKNMHLRKYYSNQQ